MPSILFIILKNTFVLFINLNEIMKPYFARVLIRAIKINA